VRLDKTAIKLWILKNHPLKNDIRFKNNLSAVFKEIKVAKPNTSITDSKILSESELKLLVKKLPTKYSLILKALYACGCRVSEILSIKLKNCVILKTHVEVKVIGKGGKETVLILSKKLFNEILREFNGKTYLFENKHTGKPITRQLVHRTFKKYGFSELNRSVYPHQTRHSRITHLLNAGKPLDAVSRFANHFDPSFTARVYGHNKLTSSEILESAII
jgi:site-specific recombinase XerD